MSRVDGWDEEGFDLIFYARELDWRRVRTPPLLFIRL